MVFWLGITLVTIVGDTSQGAEAAGARARGVLLIVRRLINYSYMQQSSIVTVDYFPLNGGKMLSSPGHHKVGLN